MMHGTLITLAALMMSHIALADTYANGAALAQAVYDRPDGDDAVSVGMMVLQETGQEPRERGLRTFGKDKGGGTTMNLIRFNSPADIKDVGMLTLDYPGANSDQWLYLPAFGKVRRVPSERQGGRFVGSDLYNEDLKDREPDLDNHTISGQGKYKGLDVYILESVPTAQDNSSYSKRISWIDPKTLLPIRVDFYQNGKLIKRSEALRIEKKQGYWTIMENRFTDLETSHTTHLKVDTIQYDTGLSDDLFTQRVLEDPQRDADFFTAPAP